MNQSLNLSVAVDLKVKIKCLYVRNTFWIEVNRLVVTLCIWKRGNTHELERKKSGELSLEFWYILFYQGKKITNKNQYLNTTTNRMSYPIFTYKHKDTKEQPIKDGIHSKIDKSV